MAGNRASPGSSPSQRGNSGDLQKKIPELAAKIVKERNPEDTRPDVIMAQDKGRFGRITDIHKCWAPKGIRPKVGKQSARTFHYVYAAVCLASEQDDFFDTALCEHADDEPVLGGSRS